MIYNHPSRVSCEREIRELALKKKLKKTGIFGSFFFILS